MITIHFKKGGRVTLAPEGYPGKTCHAATKPYEEQMAGKKTVQEGQEGVASVTAPVQIKAGNG
jgi:hypothetical protein